MKKQDLINMVREEVKFVLTEMEELDSAINPDLSPEEMSKVQYEAFDVWGHYGNTIAARTELKRRLSKYNLSDDYIDLLLNEAEQDSR